VIQQLSRLVSVENQLPFNIYPNPAGAGAPITLSLPFPSKDDLNISILDMEGKVLWQKSLPASVQQTILQGLPAGKYFIRLASHGRVGGCLLLVE
jgi:hypothetical protein